MAVVDLSTLGPDDFAGFDVYSGKNYCYDNKANKNRDVLSGNRFTQNLTANTFNRCQHWCGGNLTYNE